MLFFPVLSLLLEDQQCVGNFLSREKNNTVICDVCQCQRNKHSLYSQFQSTNLTSLKADWDLNTDGSCELIHVGFNTLLSARPFLPEPQLQGNLFFLFRQVPRALILCPDTTYFQKGLETY